jgi:hypothetical protein
MVKRARHNSYRVKRTGDRGIRHSRPPTIKLANLDSLCYAPLAMSAGRHSRQA